MKAKKILINIALVAVIIIAFGPVRKNGFVNYDDRLYITTNPYLIKGITTDSLIWAFTKPYASNWHPLTWLSHMLDCEIYGLNPAGHHITSVIIHIITTVLLFRVFFRMTGAIWPSAFVAAVFAVHPLHTESVAWAAERKDVLSGLFWILTMLAYVRYAERPNLKRYALVLAAFILGIMSKPMLVTLPFVLLLLDWWPLERIAGKKSENAFKKTSIKRLILEKIPLFALSIVSCVITLISQGSEGSFATLLTIPAGYRIGNMFVSYIKYIANAILPTRLAVFYPHSRSNLSIALVCICAFVFVVLSILSIYTGRQKKYTAVGWLWFVGTLVPVTGLVQVGAQAMADRYMYIPIVGLSIIAAWGVKDLVKGHSRLRVPAAILALGILAAFTLLTRIQTKYWQNSITLFGRALEVTENNPLAENNYGCALYEAGRFDEAIPHLKKAIQLMPAYTDPRINLGKIYLAQGKSSEAVECLTEAMNLNPGSADACYNLAMAFGIEGKYNEAIKIFGRTIQLDPDYPDVYKRMGTAMLAAGRAAEAIEYLNESLLINPYDVIVYSSLSIAYIKTGNYESALQAWARAEALQRKNAYVLNNPAWLIVTEKDVTADDAKNTIEFTERACKMTGYKEVNLIDTLAAAYAAAGRFEDAVTTAQQAIDLANARGQNKLAENIKKRKELYRAGKTFHQQ